MWVWTCPAQPDVKNEHHSKQIADILLHNHVAGVNVLGLKACPLDHELVDNGIPCKYGKKCGTPYIRNNPYEQLSLFDYERNGHENVISLISQGVVTVQEFRTQAGF